MIVKEAEVDHSAHSIDLQAATVQDVVNLWEQRNPGFEEPTGYLGNLTAAPPRVSKYPDAVDVWQPFRRGRPDGVMSDLDGTAGETTELHRQAWIIFFQKYFQIELQADEPNYFHGSNAVIVARRIGRDLTPDEARFCTEEKEVIFRELVQEHGVKPVPGAREFFRFVHKKGIPLALVTNSDRANAEIVLEKLGMASYFTERITAEDVKHPKPSSEGYRLGAERLGVDAARTIVFEDTPSGVQAALPVVGKVYIVGQTVPKSAFPSPDRVDQTVHKPTFWELRHEMGIHGNDLPNRTDRVSRRKEKRDKRRN